MFDRGRSAAAGPVVVYAFDRRDDGPPRVGLVVGRRWGNAVRRNVVRRRLREAFRTARPRLPRGHDLLLLPRGPLHEASLDAVRGHVTSAARRASARLRRDGPPPPKNRKRRKR